MIAEDETDESDGNNRMVLKEFSNSYTTRVLELTTTISFCYLEK